MTGIWVSDMDGPSQGGLGNRPSYRMRRAGMHAHPWLARLFGLRPPEGPDLNQMPLHADIACASNGDMPCPRTCPTAAPAALPTCRSTPSFWRMPKRSTSMCRARQRPASRALADEKARRWKLENAEAIRGWNEWVEKNGLPLEPYWPFRWRGLMYTRGRRTACFATSRPTFSMSWVRGSSFRWDRGTVSRL